MGNHTRFDYAHGPAVGDRVRIADVFHWAQSASGTVVAPPAAVVAASSGWRGHMRYQRTRQGLKTSCWVVFDCPQLDADGDGPYGEAEIETEYLRSPQ